MLVVARYVDGRVVKGQTTDFHPELESFHIQGSSEVPPERVPVDGLKAVFFVRSLGGNPERQDHREFPSDVGVRRKLWLEFRDGEKMAAWPVSASLGRRGFYVLPTDRESNLEKAYVFRKAVKAVLEGKEAEYASASDVRKRRADTLTRIVGVG
ncbi:MAG: hypothetical protein DHS20C21_10340 [Gemmatimonadota bacterium]|nr:MAG: hypothetical protein DHS20C21_10340 [Gemmatimonadota bacterium]